MKIQKFTKEKKNRYKVLIDDEAYTLFDDSIIKYGLLTKKEITKEELEEVLLFNHELESYYLSIQYITKKMRSEKEMHDVLEKKGYREEVIHKTIQKLKENRFLNDSLYVKAYVNDQIHLTQHGYEKIKSSLEAFGISSSQIEDALSSIPKEVWEEKIDKYIRKKIETNHHSSAKMLKMKIVTDLIHLGYRKEELMPILEKYVIMDTEIAEKEYLKLKRQLEKKYTGVTLENKIKERMYRKGFSYKEEWNNEE